MKKERSPLGLGRGHGPGMAGWVTSLYAQRSVHLQAWGRHMDRSLRSSLLSWGPSGLELLVPQFPQFQNTCFPQIMVPLFYFPLAIPEALQTPNTHFPFLSKREQDEG